MHIRAVSRKPGLSMPFSSLLLTLIAVATAGNFSYRYVATSGAEAEVSAVRPYCELISCRWGKCNSRQQMACADLPVSLEHDQHVRQFEQARLEFVGSDGKRRAAWADSSRLDKSKVHVGDRIAIHYIDGFGSEPEITPPRNLFTTVFGIAAFLYFLSIGARLRQKKRVRIGS